MEWSSFGISLALNLYECNKIETVSFFIADSASLTESSHLPSGGEAVGGGVEYVRPEDVAALLSNALAQVLIVHLHAGNVPSEARDDVGPPAWRAPLHISETRPVSWSEVYQDCDYIR